MKRATQIIVLIVAGEMIFSLPFHTARFFRPTFLDVFNLSNTNLGDIFAVYGITALLAYFPGGMLADRFSARALLAISMLATSAGGFYMASIPGAVSLALLYGYWGVSTILLFWAAMLKATREWGGEMSQGKAFGVLDGGRGLVASTFALLGASFMAGFMPDDVISASDEQQRAAFRNLILLYSSATAAVGVLTWLVLPDTESVADDGSFADSMSGARGVLAKPTVWAKSAIVIFAYCGYKGLDNLSLYAEQILEMNEVDAARMFAYVSYIRPVAAVAAGVLADRFVASRVVAWTFTVLSLSFGLLWLLIPEGEMLTLIYANIYISAFAVFAVRGIYYALMQETATPPTLTGTTIGVMSFIGYTPEILFAPIAGRILDAAPGLQGHQNYFLFLAGLSFCGLLAVFYLNRSVKRLRADHALSMPPSA